jgi:hypothetical protein
MIKKQKRDLMLFLPSVETVTSLSNHIHITHGIVLITAVTLCCKSLTSLGLGSWNHRGSDGVTGGQSGPPWPIHLLGK